MSTRRREAAMSGRETQNVSQPSDLSRLSFWVSRPDIRACSAGRPRRPLPPFLLSSVVNSFSPRALRVLRWPLLSALVFAAAVAGCSKPESPAKRTPTYTLREVALPDLSHAAPSVQQQLRDGYAALKKKIDAPATATEELGTAYGQMG